MPFELAHAEKFPYELANVPKNVQKACQHWQEKFMNREAQPGRANPPLIKRLIEFKNLWRLRIGDDYRLIYRYEPSENVLTMIMIDHRRKVYERLGLGEDGKPGLRIVAAGPELLERLPSDDDQRRAYAEMTRINISAVAEPGNNLPVTLTSEVIEALSIPEKFQRFVCSLKTEDDLLNAHELPDDIKEKIMYYLWPANLEEVMQKPVRVADSPADLEDAAEGKRKLESFLLKLDEEQLEFVTRFKSDGRPTGPWLLKGGPGSGKSTVTLYCIRSLLKNLMQQSSLFEEARPLKILYTTYTNSLVRVSEHLLKVLDVYNATHKLDVKTVDSLAARYLPEDFRQLKVCSDADTQGELIDEAVEGCMDKIKSFSFSQGDKKFLLEEIDWVIIGQGLSCVEQYLALDRAGRGRALGRQQRQHLWALYEELTEQLREKKLCLFSERLRAVSDSVSPDYDYIFIDEAQDLKPVAIRFLMNLCHNRKNVYLTADVNQSIWGYNFSWTKMAADLDVRGRVKILRRNYRTTKEIWAAVSDIAPINDTADKETLAVEAVYRGQRPTLAWYAAQSQIEKRLNEFLYQALREEKTTPASAAVLCPTAREAQYVCEMIDQKYKPKIMSSREVDITWPGVKILTMHAAKGLEFPIVALVGLEKGRLPLPPTAGLDKDEHYARQRRLFFVACSRAMRRLIVFASSHNPSPFVEDLAEERWHVERLS